MTERLQRDRVRDKEREEGGERICYWQTETGLLLCAQPGRQLTVLILAYFFLQHIGKDMHRKPQTQAHTHTHLAYIFTLALTFALTLTLAHSHSLLALDFDSSLGLAFVSFDCNREQQQ